MSIVHKPGRGILAEDGPTGSCFRRARPTVQPLTPAQQQHNRQVLEESISRRTSVRRKARAATTALLDVEESRP